MKNKLIKVLAVTVGVPLIVNEYISRMQDQLESIEDNSLFYDYKLGRIKYCVYGMEDKPPLLLVHGLDIGEDSEYWAPMLENLKDNFRVYTLDLLGYGSSDKPSMEYSPYTFVAIINDFVKNVIKEKTNVMGNGAGGDFVAIAQTMEPDLYNKIILINPKGVSDVKQYNTLRQKTLKNLIEMPLWGTFAYNIMSSKFFLESKLSMEISCLDEGLYNELRYEAESMSYSARRNGVNGKIPAAGLISDFFSVEILKALEKCDAETKIIIGDNSKSMRESEINIANNNISVSVIKGSYLRPHVENPTEFNEVVLNFFCE